MFSSGARRSAPAVIRRGSLHSECVLPTAHCECALPKAQCECALPTAQTGHARSGPFAQAASFVMTYGVVRALPIHLFSVLRARHFPANPVQSGPCRCGQPTRPLPCADAPAARKRIANPFPSGPVLSHWARLPSGARPRAHAAGTPLLLPADVNGGRDRLTSS